MPDDIDKKVMDWLYSHSEKGQLVIGKTASRLAKTQGITFREGLIEVYNFIMRFNKEG